MSKRLIALPAGVLVVVLLLAGCGGSDSSTASITKAEFIKEADAVCKEATSRILDDFGTYSKKLEAEKKTEPTESDYADLISTVLTPNVEQELEELRALGTPKGDTGQVDAVFEAQEEGVEKAEDDPKGVVTGSINAFEKSNKVAKEYGLETCSE